MAKNLNAHHIIKMDSGHLPMISNAKLLAGILTDFVNELYRLEKQRNGNIVSS
jgi:hypothetical protein